MDKKTLRKTYTNGEVTVVWQPGLCIHSAICFRGLPGVFDPRRRPWVDANAAGTQEIVDQVKKCPSGALSVFMNSEGEGSESKQVTRIEFQENGPMLVYGTVHIKHKNGEQQLENKTTAFCRCGLSQNKPYCDGSHIAGEFKD